MCKNCDMLSQYLCLLSRGHVTNVDCSNNKVRVSMYVIILQLSQKTFCQTFKDFLIFVDELSSPKIQMLMKIMSLHYLSKC